MFWEWRAPGKTPSHGSVQETDMKCIACVRIWSPYPTLERPVLASVCSACGGWASRRSPTIFRFINRTTPGDIEPEKKYRRSARLCRLMEQRAVSSFYNCIRDEKPINRMNASVSTDHVPFKYPGIIDPDPPSRFKNEHVALDTDDPRQAECCGNEDVALDNVV